MPYPYVALVEPGPVPQVHEMFSTVLWLAFASGNYLTTQRSKEFEMIFPPDARSFELLHRRLVQQPASWVLSTNHALVFPLRVVVEDDGVIRYWKDPSQAWFLPPLKKRRPPPLDKGFTNWVYRVLSLTNLNGQPFPAASLWEYYSGRVSPNAHEPELHRTMRVRLRVRRVYRSEARVGPPAIKGIALVDDYRFVVGRAPIAWFTYAVTNRWLSEKEARRTEAYRVEWTRRQQALAKLRAEPPSWPIGLLLPVVVLLLPIVFLLLRPVPGRGWR